MVQKIRKPARNVQSRGKHCIPERKEGVTMANCSPCPVETPGKQFFLPRSSAAVPNTFVTSGTSPGVSKQGKDECWCSQCPLARALQRRQHPCSPFCRGGLCVPAGSPVLHLIPLDGFMAPWGRQGREGVGHRSQVPNTQVPSTQVLLVHKHPSTQTQGSQHSTAPSHGCPNTEVPQYTATPAHRYPATQHKAVQYSNTPVHHYEPWNPTHGCT